MNNVQRFLQQFDFQTPSGYPCDRKPECICTKDGRILRIVTASSQFRLTEKGTTDSAVWAPSLYQSSMHPEHMEIRTLLVEAQNDMLYVETRYDQLSIDLSNTDVKIEVSAWVPEIHKADCLHCENCGRCGW